MRITLLTNRDLASNFALNLLLPQLSSNHELHVFCSDRVGSKPAAPGLATASFYEQTLPLELLFPLIDAQPKHGELLTFQGLNTFLLAPIASLNQPNSTEGLGTLAATEPDLMISIRYGCILEARRYRYPTKGVLNLHSGRLPEYRGVMATFRAMLAGDEKLCSTLHWIDDATIDTGRIIGIQSHDRDPTQCYLANTIGLYPAGCAAILEVVDTINAGQDPSAQAPEQRMLLFFPGSRVPRGLCGGRPSVGKPRICHRADVPLFAQSVRTGYRCSVSRSSSGAFCGKNTNQTPKTAPMLRIFLIKLRKCLFLYIK